MKTPLLATLAGVLAAAFVLAGCDGYLDINEDPNNPTDVPIASLLATSSFRTGGNVYAMGSATANYVQYLASPNSSSASDIYERISFDNTWGNLYDVMGDLALMEAKAEASGATAYLGIAKILKALHLAMLVDAWGDVPYSQSFDPNTTLTPDYDDAEALYAEVFQLLTDGIAALEAGGSTLAPGANDFIHAGNIPRWIRTGYALRARYLNHLSGTARYDAAAVLTAVDRSMTSNADDANVRYTAEQINPWANVAINNAALLLGGWLSEQTIQALDGTTQGIRDPRIEAYTDALANGTYRGTPNGAGRGTDPASGARSVLTTNTYFAARTAPIEVITYAEVKLIEAEAALRAGLRDRAYAAYLEAIRAHMTKLGVPAADATTYLSAPQIAVGAPALTLADVFREKYKVMFLNPEAWVDARRYDYAYADFTLPANALLPTYIRRLDYPDTEYERNGANVPAGGSTLTDPIWWDR